VLDVVQFYVVQVIYVLWEILHLTKHLKLLFSVDDYIFRLEKILYVGF